MQAVADHIPQLVQGVRGSQAKPEELSAQLALIIASQNFLQVGARLALCRDADLLQLRNQAKQSINSVCLVGNC